MYVFSFWHLGVRVREDLGACSEGHSKCAKVDIQNSHRAVAHLFGKAHEDKRYPLFFYLFGKYLLSDDGMIGRLILARPRK